LHQFYSEVKIKSLRISLLLLGSLMILSFAFFTTAQDKATTSNNVFLDSDQDGLADSEEKTLGTDPFKKDTDGDGYSDGTEVKSGYDPTKPAPGDKIVADENKTTLATGTADTPENLTKNLETKIETLMSEREASGQSISMEEVQGLIDESLATPIKEPVIPEVKPEDVKIKKQNYSKLSKEEKAAKEKEDFVEYLSAISYVLSSNSPKPITSKSDAQSLLSSFATQISSALANQNPAAIAELSKSGEKTLEQMKEVEVPESLADLHVKGLALANQLQSIKDYVAPTAGDPLSGMINISKVQSIFEVMAGFGSDLESKLVENEFLLDVSLKQFLDTSKNTTVKK
jgi:hypothetical protein